MAVAVVSAGSCSSNSTPSLGTSIYFWCSPKKKKKKKKPEWPKEEDFGHFEPATSQIQRLAEVVRRVGEGPGVEEKIEGR